MEDKTLAERCARGDNEAWSLFLERYGDLLRFLIRRSLISMSGRAPAHEVDDFHDEIVAWLNEGGGRVLRTFRAESKLSSWLGVVVTRRVKRLIHRQARREGGKVSLDALTVEGATDLSKDHRGLDGGYPPEALDRLREALETLSPREQSLLKGAFLQKRRYDELAEELGVKEGSIGQLLYRAKVKLKKKLGGEKFLELLSGSLALLLSCFGSLGS